MTYDIPMVDLKRQYDNLRLEIDEAIHAVLRDAAFIGGARVTNFEDAFAKACEIKHCVSVASGTDALHITVRALGIGLGDEVIVPATTWIACSEAVSLSGAVPIFADVEDAYFCVDPYSVEAKITERTKAIIAVHLFGQPAALDELLSIAGVHRLLLIEDCAQAHFAKYRGIGVGGFGTVAAYSFYPAKNLGAYGDAGAVVTNDENIAEKCRMLAHHGATTKHQHEIEGMNSRMDAIQAAVLSVKLSHVAAWNEQRRRHAQHYDSLLADIPEVTTPLVRHGAEHVFHVYQLKCAHRDQLETFLNNKGIATHRYYPNALPFLNAYRWREHSAEEFPISQRLKSQTLALPMFPELTDEEIERVALTIRKFYRYGRDSYHDL